MPPKRRRPKQGCGEYPGNDCLLVATLEFYCRSCRRTHRYTLTEQALDALLNRLEAIPSPLEPEKDNNNGEEKPDPKNLN